MTPPITATATPTETPPDGGTATGPATAPDARAAAPASDSASPYQLQLSGGYAALNLGSEAPTYSGGQFEARVGQNFYVHPQHSFSLNGVFRLAGLSNNSGENLNLVHFGLEAGYEAWVAPRIFSLFAFAGLGTNILHATGAEVAPGVTRDLNNQSMLALTLGGGFTLGRGILVFSGGWQPNFGLSVPAEEGVPGRGFNPQYYFFNVGLDLARFADWAGGPFPRNESIGDWVRGINPGFTADTSYTYNFGQPAGGVMPLRVFQSRWDRPQLNWTALTLDRPVDAEHPFGFRLNFGLGENVAGQAARSSFSGQFAEGSAGSFGYDLQEFYARLRLPIGEGLTLRGGKFATIVGNEVLESLNNNHMSHSFQFLYAIPFTHLGMLGEYTFNGSIPVTLSGGIVNGWDNVLDRNTGIAALGAINVAWTPQFSTYISSSVGDEGGRLRSIMDVIMRLKPIDPLSFTLEYDWGHEGEGAGMPEANWHAASLTGRYDFNQYVGLSARGEVFEDSNGVRTGAPQTLFGVTGTVHVTPVPWLRLRAEVRHDRSSDEPFMSGTNFVGDQTTIGIGAGVVLPQP